MEVELVVGRRETQADLLPHIRAGICYHWEVSRHQRVARQRLVDVEQDICWRNRERVRGDAGRRYQVGPELLVLRDGIVQ